MRYQRNIKIFRGGVDAAPFAGLFFATVLFMVLLYSHVFFPGVPVAMAPVEEAPDLGERAVEVLRNGMIRFLGQEMNIDGLKEALQERNQIGELPQRILLQSEAGADEDLERAVENLLKDAGMAIKLPGTRMALPPDAGFAGAMNPVVVVGVNLNGQIFFQHQLIQRNRLQTRLAEMVARTGGPLTMVLQADRKVAVEEIVALSEVAREAGIAEVRVATRPPVL